MIVQGPEGFVSCRRAMLTRIHYVQAVLANSQSSVGTADLCMEELERLVEELPEDVAMGVIAVDTDGNLKRRS